MPKGKKVTDHLPLQKLNVIVLGVIAYPLGMASTQRVKHYMDALQKDGHTVNLMLGAFPDWPGQKASGNHEGIAYRCLEKKRRGFLSSLILIPWKLLVGFSLINRWKKPGKNCLFIYDGINLENLPLVLFAKMLGYKVVVDLVEDYSLDIEKQSRGRKLKLKSQIALEPHLPKLIDSLVVISTYLQSKYRFINEKGIPVLIIPITAAIGKNSKKQPSPTVKFIYSGSFGKKDHVDGLIKAFNRLAEQHTDCELLLSGKGAHIEELMTLVKTDRVKYLGYLNDSEFKQFLNDGDVMCMTRNVSDYASAGFPFKLGEYLATGKPVIASDVGDVSHYLVDKQDAILVEPGSIEAIYEAMTYTMLHKAEMTAMGGRGKEKCQKYFDASKNGELLINLLTSI